MDKNQTRQRRKDGGAQNDAKSSKSKTSVNVTEDEDVYYRKLERRGRNMALIIIVYMVLCVAVFLWFQMGRVPTPVLVVIVPGFRADYLDRLPSIQLPFLSALSAEGSRAAWLQPAFPVSDLRARLLPLIYGNEPADSSGGLPIWSSAVRQWRTVALYGVPDSCQQLSGYSVHECRPPSPDATAQQFTTGLRQAASALLAGHTNLAVVHTDLIERAANLHGPLADKTLQNVRQLDRILSLLSEDASLLQEVNVFIISDGGTTDIGAKRRVSLSQHLPKDTVWKFVGGGGGGVLYTNPQHVQQVTDSLTRVKGVRVQRRSHQSQQSLTALMVTVDNSSVLEWSDSSQRAGFNYDQSAGTDGTAMRGVMMARGPGIRRGFRLGPVEARDVYPLLAALLDITPELHSGSLGQTADMVIW